MTAYPIRTNPTTGETEILDPESGAVVATGTLAADLVIHPDKSVLIRAGVKFVGRGTRAE